MAGTVDHKAAALERLAAFRVSVDAMATDAGVGDLPELIDSLERAVQAFHMEAIRFRMFTIGRRLSQAGGLPPEIAASFEQLRTSLESAGFHTRSVS